MSTSLSGHKERKFLIICVITRHQLFFFQLLFNCMILLPWTWFTILPRTTDVWKNKHTPPLTWTLQLYPILHLLRTNLFLQIKKWEKDLKMIRQKTLFCGPRKKTSGDENEKSEKLKSAPAKKAKKRRIGNVFWEIHFAHYQWIEKRQKNGKQQKMKQKNEPRRKKKKTWKKKNKLKKMHWNKPSERLKEINKNL